MVLIKKYYICIIGGFRQFLNTDFFFQLSSLASRLSGEAFLLLKTKPRFFMPGLNYNRSVSKIFDCVGLTKPQSISKLLFICYLRLYAAILSNVAELTTLRKQSQMVFSQYLKWQLIGKSSVDNKPAFCLVSVVKKMEKNLFFALPLY